VRQQPHDDKQHTVRGRDANLLGRDLVEREEDAGREHHEQGNHVERNETIHLVFCFLFVVVVVVVVVVFSFCSFLFPRWRKVHRYVNMSF